MSDPAATAKPEPTAQDLWDAELSAADASTPAAEVVAPTPVQTPAAPAAVATPAAVDPYAGLHPSIRTRLESVDALAERLRKAEGHIGGLSSENKRLKEEFVATAKAVSATGARAPTQAQVSTVKWDQLKTEFPEWAEALEERLGGVNTAQPDIDGLRNQIREELTSQLTTSISATLKSEIAAETEGRLVNAAHRNWRDTVKTKDFSDWYEKQGSDVQALGASPKAEDAMALLDKYQAQKAGTPAADPAAIKAARAARLQDAATVARGGSTTVPVKSTEDMTPQEYWNHLAAQKK